MPDLPSASSLAGNSVDNDFVLISTESLPLNTEVAPPPSAPKAIESEHSDELFVVVQTSDAQDVPLETTPDITGPTAVPTALTTSKRASKKRKTKVAAAPGSATESIAARQLQVEARIAQLESLANAAETTPPTLVQPRVAQQGNATYSSARDVWYHVRPVDTAASVQATEIASEIESDASYQRAIDFSTLRHPKSTHLRCIPCLKMKQTHVWANNPGGVTTRIREHMSTLHPVSYYSTCQREGLTNRLANASGHDNAQPEFTPPGLMDRLVNFAVSNDQPLNLVESAEFREILLYAGQGRIQENDIPHRDRFATAAWAMYLIEKNKIDQEMKRARGRISLTSDLWSDGNLRSFMAVTAHYIDESARLQDHLIAFRKIDGQHTGANVAQALFRVMQESDIVEKVGYITLDNASNNNTLMHELAAVLGVHGAQFDAERNRIRCFPHVMNLAVQAVINALDKAAAAFRAEMREADLPIDDVVERYLQALEAVPVDLVRTSVNACRSSGSRREGLRNAIIEGNRLGRFHLPDGTLYTVPTLQLLRDVPTRWSSTFNMLSRYIDLYPAIVQYALEVRRDIQIPVISHKQYEVVQDVVAVHAIAHNAQELLSAEKTPTLALAFPVYEAVIESWQQLCVAIPELAYAITAGIEKLQEYTLRTQDAPVHALAMFINPSLKLNWICQHWSPAQAAQAEATIKAEMLSRQQTLNPSRREVLPSSRAAGASTRQQHGFMRVLASNHNSRRASQLRVSPPSTSASSNYPSRTLNTPQSSVSNHFVYIDTHAQNQAIVEHEFARYMADNAFANEAEGNSEPAEGQMGSLDLVRYWRDHQYTYPLVFRLAMDVLPAQASSVSSERVFSSSKLTSTSERNRLTTESMEYLQVLKHALIRRRRGLQDGEGFHDLDFVSHQFENLVLDDD